MIGFVAGKLYYLMTVFGDRIFSRGASKRYLLVFGAAVVGVFWAYSALLYLNVIYFPWPLPTGTAGTNWMLNSGLPLGLTRTATTDVRSGGDLRDLSGLVLPGDGARQGGPQARPGARG